MRTRQTLLILALVCLLRLPFLAQPVQGDDVYYLYGAEHAQLDPLHPLTTHYAFMGDLVDMRGHPHGPVDPWILGTLIAAFGGFREVPFHVAYLAFSLIVAWSMLSIARRLLPSGGPRLLDIPVIATLLFLAVPAFVINGNSFEADLPFLAFFLAAMALFLRAADLQSMPTLIGASLCAAIATLTAYQGILLIPIWMVYLYVAQRKLWLPSIIALLSPILAIAAWQLWGLETEGVMPARVLMGYMQSGSLQKIPDKLRSAAALTVHLAWMISPLAWVAWIWFRHRGGAKVFSSPMVTALIAAVGAAVYQFNPLFWLSFGLGVFLIATMITWLANPVRQFLAAWVLIFFFGATVIFFAGSARYLLPVAAPLAMMAAALLPARILIPVFAAQFVLSIAVATANYQHWVGVRDFAESAVNDFVTANGAPDWAGKRLWVNAELGIRYYLEARGGLPLLQSTDLRPGDWIVTSELVRPVNVTAPVSELRLADVSPAVPLRLISIAGGSGYSTSAKGLLPFEISRGPADRLRILRVMERTADLTYLDPRDPKAQSQLISGMFPDGWTSDRASVLLKAPPNADSIEVAVFIPDSAPARHITIRANGSVLAEQQFPAPGAFTVSAPFRNPQRAPTVTVVLTADPTHTVPSDLRQLGLIVTGIGFRCGQRACP